MLQSIRFTHSKRLVDATALEEAIMIYDGCLVTTNCYAMYVCFVNVMDEIGDALQGLYREWFVLWS